MKNRSLLLRPVVTTFNGVVVSLRRLFAFTGAPFGFPLESPFTFTGIPDLKSPPVSNGFSA